jgi:hypothetical protein
MLSAQARAYLRTLASSAGLSMSETVERLIRACPPEDAPTVLADAPWQEATDYAASSIAP